MTAALVRLALFAGSLYFVIQVARVAPGLAFPIGILVAVFAGLWVSSALYDEQQAMEGLADNAAIDDEFGPHMAALATEDHHDRWEDQ